MNSGASQPVWVSALLDKGLSPIERILLALLARYQGGNDRAWPSRSMLAADLGTSERTVKRLIASLARKGKLTVSRPERQGRGQRNEYIVHLGGKGGQQCPPSTPDKGDVDVSLLSREGGQDCPEKGDKSRHVTKVYKDEIVSESANRDRTPKTRAQDGNGELFDRFWSGYPKKVAKEPARKAWAKLRPDADLAGRIIAGVESYAATEQWQRDGGRFIPNPATFLNQRRWEDEVEPATVGAALGCGPCDEDEARQLLKDAGLWKGEQ